MSAVEIPNALDAMLTFTAANPPVIVSRSSNIVGVTRTAAGEYTVELRDKLAPSGVGAVGHQLMCQPNIATATFANALSDVDGNVSVFARSLAGALADTGAAIDLQIWRYPTLA